MSETAELFADDKADETPAEEDDFLTLHAREIAGLPENWRAYSWEAKGFGPNFDQPSTHIVVTGAVVTRRVTKGRRKGEWDWKSRDAGTDMPVTIPTSLHKQWLRKWEIANNKCSDCRGSGREIASMGVSGTTYRTCTKCCGSGKPKGPPHE